MIKILFLLLFNIAFTTAQAQSCDSLFALSRLQILRAKAVTDDLRIENAKGISREFIDNKPIYRSENNLIISDPQILVRIQALAVPPAWTEVKISADPNSYIQASGKDKRERNQLIYHPRWIEISSEVKFSQLQTFAEGLPELREKVEKDLHTAGLNKNKVTALIVRLLEKTLIRVGNEKYAVKNESYGLTTMLKSHVEDQGNKIIFRFKGKSYTSKKGEKETEKIIADSESIKILRELLQLPGDNLFFVNSADVNKYIKEVFPFSAKDFRTWMGTVYAATFLAELPEPKTQKENEENRRQAIKYAASFLSNTPAVCESSYIHPQILRSYSENYQDFIRPFKKSVSKEQAVLDLISTGS